MTWSPSPARISPGMLELGAPLRTLSLRGAECIGKQGQRFSTGALVAYAVLSAAAVFSRPGPDTLHSPASAILRRLISERSVYL